MADRLPPADEAVGAQEARRAFLEKRKASWTV